VSLVRGDRGDGAVRVGDRGVGAAVERRHEVAARLIADRGEHRAVRLAPGDVELVEARGDRRPGLRRDVVRHDLAAADRRRGRIDVQRELLQVVKDDVRAAGERGAGRLRVAMFVDDIARHAARPEAGDAQRLVAEEDEGAVAVGGRGDGVGGGQRRRAQDIAGGVVGGDGGGQLRVGIDGHERAAVPQQQVAVARAHVAALGDAAAGRDHERGAVAEHERGAAVRRGGQQHRRG
jgi:hypothetical protein